jgi:hypothetical protein
VDFPDKESGKKETRLKSQEQRLKKGVWSLAGWDLGFVICDLCFVICVLWLKKKLEVRGTRYEVRIGEEKNQLR